MDTNDLRQQEAQIELQMDYPAVDVVNQHDDGCGSHHGICNRDHVKEKKRMRKKRTLTIELSDEDMRRLCEKAGSVSMTVGGLLENFIADLIGGEGTNGSDERMYINQWFCRCGFYALWDMSFLAWLIDMELLEDAIYEWESIQSINKKGVKDQDDQEELHEHWDNLKSWLTEYRDTGGEHSDLEREMEKAIEWKQEYDHLMEGEGDDEARPEPDEH